jgi:hypothetical protein
MSIMHCSLLSLGCVFGFTPDAEKTTLTALRALKIAQRRLRPEVRAKLLSVSSARTDGSFAPEAWRFVFLDEATSGHSRVVTVAAKASSEHPDTIEAFSSSKPDDLDILHPIAQNKFVVDSDKVLEQARGETKLKGMLSAEYRLLQPRSGKEPVWHLHFYGREEEPIFSFEVSAKSGAMECIACGEDKVLCGA